MAPTKTKTATVLLLAVGLLAAGVAAGTAVRGQRVTAADQPAKPPAATRAQPPAAEVQPPAADDNDAVAYTGSVVGPDGKPVAGASVYYHFITREAERVPVRAVTDAQGQFSFTLTRKDVPLSADAIQRDPRKIGNVVVKADGYTFAWRAAALHRGDLPLQLARDDTPVEGRVIDLQGRPVVGLRVTALSAAAPGKGDLSKFLKGLRAGESFYEALYHYADNVLANPVIGRSVDELLPSTTTDADGRFRLPGFTPEEVVQLRLAGAGVETQDVYVVTRSLGADSKRLLTPPRIKDPVFGPDAPVVVLGNGFEHAVAPGQTVVGTVRDAVTGAPIPGAVVETYQLAGTKLAQNTIYRTAADGRGRYRFTGLPRGKGNRLRFRPPQDQPYLPVVKAVPAAETFADATLDAALQPGVWVDVTATDRTTGKPVPGYVSYFALPEKRTPESFFQRPYADAYNDMMPIRNDGTFRFAAAPGKAVVAFKTDWDRYPVAREAATVWLPGGLLPSNYQAFADIDPKPGDGPVKVAFGLSAERVVTGKLVGPDGRPVAGALAAGMRDDWFWQPVLPLKTDSFTAIGLDPARPRLLCFVQPEKKLAGSVVVRGDEAGPVTVGLRPWAAVSGRLLDTDGKPIKNVTLAFTEVPVRKAGRPMDTDTGLHVVTHFAGQPDPDPKTDEDGRFHVERLVPGLRYNLAQFEYDATLGPGEYRWEGLAFRGLVLKPGEARDLGDVKLQPFPKE
jgi:protocatechuate 3,4-dioxygenase beta subunit